MDDPSELLGDGGLFKQLKKAMMEKVLDAEIAEHLGYNKHEVAGRGSGNSRNGHNRKRVLTVETRCQDLTLDTIGGRKMSSV